MKPLFMVICGCLLASMPVRAQELGYAPKQLLVSFNNKEDAVLQTQNGRMTCMYSTVMSVLEKYNATSMRRLYSGDKGAKNIYLIELGSDADVDLAIAELRNDSEIRGASRNYAIEFLAHPNDWYYNNDYVYPGLPDTSAGGSFLKLMQVDKAWDVQTGSPETTIGILDTGVDFFHQELLGNIWVNPGEDLDADGVVWDVDDLDGEDSDGNGLVDDLVGWTFTTLSPGDNYPYPDTLQSDYQHGTIMASALFRITTLT
jgi:subtilisin family serine protease